ncbi:MAG: KpsF/GutQ family sugar-phosphate isomerase [Bacteroidales bacterium]|nr:KpsF/GutQ family sugar-phosphate isomerase [Bacteroidales bacterium]
MDFIQKSREVFDQEICELQKVSTNIGNEINDVVELIYNCKGKVVVTGIGKTGLIGRKIAASLASTGTLSVFMNSTDALHGDLGMVRKDDIVMAISNSGSSQEIMNILSPLRKIGATIVAMTGDLESPLAKEADLILNIGVSREACPLDLAPTTSTTATLVMGDALTICLMERRNFKMEEYAVFHPGGALGRRLLTRVEDLMSKEIPIVRESDSFKDVIYVISDRRKGMTMVVNSEDKMTGIVTDGDIRRAIQNYDDVVSKRAIDFMTHGFKKIARNAQINDALEMMTASKITSIAVCEPKDSSVIVGLITIHDIIDFNK